MIIIDIHRTVASHPIMYKQATEIQQGGESPVYFAESDSKSRQMGIPSIGESSQIELPTQKPRPYDCSTTAARTLAPADQLKDGAPTPTESSDFKFDDSTGTTTRKFAQFICKRINTFLSISNPIACNMNVSPSHKS